MARIVRADPYLTREDTGADEGNTPAIQHYEKQSGSDGATSNTVFTLSKPYVQGSNTLVIYLNGQKAELLVSASDETEYEETSSSTVTFGASLLDTDVVEFMVYGTYFIQDTDIYVTKALADNRNSIINPRMDIAQRHTSKASASGTSGNWIVDRFEYLESSAAVVTISRAEDAPTFAEAGVSTEHSAKIIVTTADASIAASDYAIIQYQFEGQDVWGLTGKPCTLSFWVKATVTGTSCVAFKAPAVPGYYIHEFTIAASEVWQKVELTMTIPAAYAATGEIENDNTTGLRIYWPLAAGTTHHGPVTDSWTDSTGVTYFSTSNQVNHLATTNNVYQITNVKLEPGSEATPIIPRLHEEELALCQRYYEKSYDPDVDPGTVTEAGVYIDFSQVTGTMYMNIDFAVVKRSAPTVVPYSSVNGTANSWYDYTAAADDTTGLSVYGTADRRVTLRNTSATAGNLYSAHWTADAEL
jgi:hypothetical protein